MSARGGLGTARPKAASKLLREISRRDSFSQLIFFANVRAFSRCTSGSACSSRAGSKPHRERSCPPLSVYTHPSAGGDRSWHARRGPVRRQCVRRTSRRLDLPLLSRAPPLDESPKGFDRARSSALANTQAAPRSLAFLFPYLDFSGASPASPDRQGSGVSPIERPPRTISFPTPGETARYRDETPTRRRCLAQASE